MYSDSAPFIHERWMLLVVLFILLSGATGCASTGAQFTAKGTRDFPVPPQIQDNVDFWRHVYGIWSRDQVAFHDDTWMSVVYEVARIPSGMDERERKRWVKARMEHHAARLGRIQGKLDGNDTLSSEERELLAQYNAVGGQAAFRGAAKRLRSQRGLQERFRRGVEISGRYDAIFRKIMRQHHVPEDLAYLPHVESSFQTHARSSVGAGGVWQFMPSTGRLFMTVNDRIDERFDPILAADGAARYLAQAYRKLGSWPLAITSYNHGQAGMMSAKSMHGDDIGVIVERYQGRAFGFASRNFYAEFIAAREVASHPQRYFSGTLRYESPWNHDRLVLAYSMPVTHLSSHYKTSPSQLASINLHWRDKVSNGRTSLPRGTTVWLPENTLQRIASHPPRPASNIRVAAARKPQITNPAQAPSTPVQTARYHVVKPQETLYRVAVQNGLTVAELRRLNQLSPNDNHIHPGQRLKVGS